MAGEIKGKKKRKNRKTSEKWKKYSIEADKSKKTSRECPRCGAGIFLGKHKDRFFCGKCHYTSFDKAEIEAANK